MVLPSPTVQVRQPRSRSTANEDVPYAVGAMLAISAMALEVLAIKCNLIFRLF